MKKLCGLLAIAALFAFFGTRANAQTPAYQPVVLWQGTNYANTGTNLVTSTGGTTPLVIFVGNQQNMTLEWVCSATTGNGTNAIAVADSVDGNLFGPYRLYVMNGLGAGTNVACTNMVVGGVGYCKIGFMTNWFMTGDLTNCYIKYGVKRSSP